MLKIFTIVGVVLMVSSIACNKDGDSQKRLQSVSMN